MSYDYETYRRLTETSSARHISEEEWEELTLDHHKRTAAGYSLITLVIVIMAMFFGILIAKSVPEKNTEHKGCHLRHYKCWLDSDFSAVSSVQRKKQIQRFVRS